MDRQHRHDLKHDKFVDEVGVWSGRARQNQRLLLMIAGAVVTIAILAFGIHFYRSNRESRAQQALASAIETAEANVAGTPSNPAAGEPAPKFKTELERDAAAEKEFKALRDNFSGTDAADVAGLYLARIAAGKGDAAGARKLLEAFVDEQEGHILAGTARYSLYQLRIENGDAAQVVVELNAELARAEPVLPADTILALLASAYDQQGNSAKAEETYRRIVSEFPDSPFAQDARRRTGEA